MDNICAKLKQREKNKYRALISVDSKLYNIPPITADLAITYTPGALLEEGEWFCIKDASKTDYSIDLLSSKDTSVDYQALDRKDFSRIDFVFVLSDNYIAFQNVSKSKLLSKRRVLALGETYEYQDECSEIVINDLPDALYDKTNDTLYRTSLSEVIIVSEFRSALLRLNPWLTDAQADDLVMEMQQYSSRNPLDANIEVFDRLTLGFSAFN